MPSKEEEIFYLLHSRLWEDDIKDLNNFPNQRPLLAHYTTIENLKDIIESDEVWFSNPLFMNDFEEVRFGILEGARLFRQHEGIKLACKNEFYDDLLIEFENQLEDFSNNHAFDIYVFCLSKHEYTDNDGLLSMWRGYGGNGNGAAIVIDLKKVNYVEDSPLVISKVTYGSEEERLKWIEDKLIIFAKFLSEIQLSEQVIRGLIQVFFERLKIFSIFTKHNGFREEEEWRIAYIKERDRGDKLNQFLDYAMGKQGVEPKLKLKIEHLEGIIDDNISLEKIIGRIILGPSVSNPLAVKAVERMFEKIEKPNLKTKLVESTTPYRPL